MHRYANARQTMWQLTVKQADGSLKKVTVAYDDKAVQEVVSQYLNDTTVGLATFTPLLSLSYGHIYHISDPPYTEVIQATVTTPVYITGVEIGSPQRIGVLVPLQLPPSAIQPLDTPGHA